MKSVIMGSLGALLAAGAASAAEVSAHKASTSAPALFYGGLSAKPTTASGESASNDARLVPAGAYGRLSLGDLQAGYNWRRGPLVFGLIGDAWCDPSFSSTDDHVSALGLRNRLDTQLSLRGRIGYSSERTLLFFSFGAEAAYFAREYQAPLVYRHSHYVVAAPTGGVGFKYVLDKNSSVFAEYRVIGGGAAPQVVNFAPLGGKTGPRPIGGVGTVGLKYRF